MVNATVDNTPVKEVITSGNSVSVPSGETWKVTINCSPTVANFSSGNSTERGQVLIDGTSVAGVESQTYQSSSNNQASAVASETVPFDAVLPGGTTIGAQDISVIVSGFVVN